MVLLNNEAALYTTVNNKIIMRTMAQYTHSAKRWAPQAPIHHSSFWTTLYIFVSLVLVLTAIRANGQSIYLVICNGGISEAISGWLSARHGRAELDSNLGGLFKFKFAAAAIWAAGSDYSRW